jgi:hypothetical protein
LGDSIATTEEVRQMMMPRRRCIICGSRVLHATTGDSTLAAQVACQVSSLMSRNML